MKRLFFILAAAIMAASAMAADVKIKIVEHFEGVKK